MGELDEKASTDSRWVLATWTVTAVGGVYAAIVLAVSAAYDGSVLITLGWTTAVGAALLGFGLATWRLSTRPALRSSGLAIVAAICVVGLIYGLSAAIT